MGKGRKTLVLVIAKIRKKYTLKALLNYTKLAKSTYYDALKNIVEIFYVTHYNICNAILRTSFANTMRWNKIIIAINILNSIKTIDDNDVTDVDPEIIKDIISSNINLSLYGIRVM